MPDAPGLHRPDGEDAAEADVGDVLAVLARQADTLSPDARAIVRAGTVLDPPFTLAEVAAVCERPPSELRPAAAEAVRSGQLVGDDHGLTFRDVITREALYRSLSPPIRQKLHRQAAAVAEAEGGTIGEVVRHLGRGGAESIRRARRLLVTAIRAETFRSPGTAVQFAAQLLDLTDDLDETTASLVADTMRGLIGAGRIEQARALGGRAIRRPGPPSGDGLALRALVEVCGRFGARDAVVTHTGGLLRRYRLPAATRAELFAEQAYALMGSAALAEAERPGGAAVTLGAQADCPTAVALGASVCSAIAATRGELGQAHDMARRAVRASEAAGPHACRYPRLQLARVLAAMDRFDEAHEELTRCERAADAGSAAWVRGPVRLQRAELLLSAGLVQAAGAEAEAGLAAEDLDVPVKSRLLAALSEAAMRQGRLDLAQQAIDRAAGLADRVPDYLRGFVIYRAALLAEAGRKVPAALRAERLSNLTSVLAGCPSAASALVRHALREAAVAPARRVVTAIGDLAEANPDVTSLAAAAAHASGLLDGDRTALDRAVELFRRSPRPLDRACALEDAATAAIDANDRDRARELLRQAEDTYSALRVTPAAERVRERADRCAREPAPAAADPGHSWSDLTDSEMRVVRLIVKGMTNREVASSLFLSPHTVDSHLRHSFAKLNVRTRVELARLFFTRKGREYPVNA